MQIYFIDPTTANLKPAAKQYDDGTSTMDGRRQFLPPTTAASNHASSTSCTTESLSTCRCCIMKQRRQRSKTTMSQQSLHSDRSFCPMDTCFPLESASKVARLPPRNKNKQEKLFSNDKDSDDDDDDLNQPPLKEINLQPIIPLVELRQLFPQIGMEEASWRLMEAGIRFPDHFLLKITPQTQIAMQHVVADLTTLYGTPITTSTDDAVLEAVVNDLPDSSGIKRRTYATLDSKKDALSSFRSNSDYNSSPNFHRAKDKALVNNYLPTVSPINDSTIPTLLKKSSSSSSSLPTTSSGNDNDSSTSSNSTVVIECPCCYEEVQIENSVSCKDSGHIYCRDCIRRHAEALIFGSASLGKHKQTGETNTELQCIDENCCSGFKYYDLLQAFSPKVLERYGELQGKLMLEKANLDELCTCPKCGFQALLEKDERIFPCQNDDCQFRSCRECGKPPHGNVPCLEARVQGAKDKVRHSMEEAMTAALLRICSNPSCKRALVKDGGCNKVTCSCGWSLCNICKQRVHGYDHFCNVFDCQHENCGKCGLYKNADEDDRRAIEEAQHEGQRQMEEVMTRIMEDEDQRIIDDNDSNLPGNNDGVFRFNTSPQDCNRNNNEKKKKNLFKRAWKKVRRRITRRR